MPKIIKLADKEIVAFCHENSDWGVFSNNAATPITMPTSAGDKLFPTVTHYFHYMKDPSDIAYLEAILACDTLKKVSELGREHFEALPADKKTDWQDQGGCDKAMDAAINAKLAQHPAVKQALMQTENACIIYDTGSMGIQNGTWGLRSGGKKTDYAPAADVTTLPPGNKLGILWMEHRNLIFKATDMNDAVIEDPSGFSEDVRQIFATKLPTSYLLDPAANLPFREAPAFSSSLTKSADTESTNASSALNDTSRVSALIIELNKDGANWKVDTAKSIPNGDQVITDGTRNFTVTADSISTKDADLATFRAILKSFMFQNPGDKPKITVNNAMLENLWKKACNELSIEADISIITTPSQTPAEQPTQHNSPRPS